ncbi:cobalamin-binding domain-containing protein, partial [Candidatus Pacearchaeota archaeon]|nr:cobalamin-binding domain-containing protein [Candidatus Pacearchaeota archaeon]
GDHVVFVKGRSPEHREKEWDRIYITTLFTFHWNKTVQTIRYYARSAKNTENVFVGGILATLMADELKKELSPTINVTIIRGLLNKPGMLDSDSKQIIEDMIPNYSILNEIEYEYRMADGYLGYATRGCVNKCSFCAVRTLEPRPEYKCQYHSSVLNLVQSVDKVYGQKRDLLLLDNNILASPDFKRIIHEILDSGFEKGAKLNRKLRRLDFNQGIDARLLTVTKMKLLAQTAISPLRLAFDNSRMRKSYEKAVRLACKYGLIRQSTYVLFNFNDTPEDFYSRLQINLDLNDELGAKISSFPMKYIPLNSKNRRHIGKHWHRKMIRGVQCILLATKGMVSPRREFFEAAFGRDEKEFREICMMPEHYIIYRRNNDEFAAEWRKLYHQLGSTQHRQLLEILSKGRIKKEDCAEETGRLRNIMEHYIEPT